MATSRTVAAQWRHSHHFRAGQRIVHYILAPARGVPEVAEPQQQHSAAAAAAAELDGHGGAPAAPRADGAPEELDEQILKQVEQLGFSAELVSQSVRAKAYDHPSACYHMLRRKAAAAACQPVAW